MTRALAIALVAVVACTAAAAASPTRAVARPIVVLVRHGGLCYPGALCRSELMITDTTITDGARSRPLSAAARRSLLSAIGELNRAYLRRHPFTGMCPMAYDGQESIYRFRGFRPSIPSCTYDVSGMRAVRLTERLLAKLMPIR